MMCKQIMNNISVFECVNMVYQNQKLFTKFYLFHCTLNYLFKLL